MIILVIQITSAACGCADFNGNGKVEDKIWEIETIQRGCYAADLDGGWYVYVVATCDWIDLDKCQTLCVDKGYTGVSGYECLQGVRCVAIGEVNSIGNCFCYTEYKDDLDYITERLGTTEVTYSNANNRYDLNNDGTINNLDITECFIPQNTTYPSNEQEVCDGLDNNCDAVIDKGCDDDEDDYCDSSITYDKDALTCTLGGNDCNDEDRKINPGIIDTLCNGIDENCDGIGTGTDADKDGYYTNDPNCPIDCNDNAELIHPFAIERLDGLDNDCDGTIDEGAVLVEGWYRTSGNNNLNFETITGYEGKSVIKIRDIDDSSYGIESDVVTALKTTTYTAKADVYCISGFIDLKLNINNNQRSNKVSSSTNNWETLEVSIDVNTGEKILVQLETLATGNAECYVDNARLLGGLPELDSGDITELSCCPNNYCWNGDKCVIGLTSFTKQDYLTSPNAFTLNGWTTEVEIPSMYVCEDRNGIADWHLGYKKVHPTDITQYAYCTSQAACFDGTRCVDDGSFFSDAYCNNGEWTSRTALIAEQLIALAGSNDYVLYCDEHNKVLNRFDNYNIEGKNVEQYIKGMKQGTLGTYTYTCYDSQPCTNNYCVILYNNNIIFGTSLNAPLNDERNEFLKVIDKESYSNAIGGTDYKHLTITDTDTMYNDATDSIIFSNNNIPLINSPTIGEFLGLLFRHPILTLTTVLRPKRTTTILGEINEEIINIGFANKTKDFNRIYVNKQGDKEILGILERISDEESYLMVVYTNFNSDICKATASNNLICNNTAEQGKTYVLTDIGSKSDFTIWNNRWKNLGAKLRPK
ncbi:putative metal-binding motif-containing protein [Candidatus Woesearchaeota archaeon]|nr:putative metal-binding motif-containing protein [Candidatus Woesearchaeota archaeon]